MRLLWGLSCIVFAFGCSDDDKFNRLPDAPPAPDTPDIDAATKGPVSVTILDGLDPRVGIRVLFQNADSSVVSETTTGTDGKATAIMDAGGFVTAFDPLPARGQGGVSIPDLRTFSGVKPGDQLRIVAPVIAAATTTVDITLPVQTGAVDYRVATNCTPNFDYQFVAPGSGSQPGGTMFLSGCGPTSNLLVETTDTNGLFTYIYKPNVAITEGGVINLTADTYTAMNATTYTVSNVAAAYPSVSFTGILATSVGQIRRFNTSIDTSTGSGTLATKLPTVTGATAVNMTTFFGSTTYHNVLEWGTPGSHTLDAAAALLPDFTNRPAIDAATHKLTWGLTGGAVQPDATDIRVTLRRDVGGNISLWTWEVVAAGGPDAVLPVLPTADAALNPVAGDTMTAILRIAKVPGGYDAIRANAIGLVEEAIPVPIASGKAAFAVYVEPEAFTRPVR